MQYTTGLLFRATLRVLPARIHLLVVVALGYPVAAPATGRRKPLRQVVRWEG